ncbi:MAG: hypothetical protein BWY56_01089 [Acidobacteria bacterium ADurb.Bin340]|nr:MAG: hypothetical protein BWY56_01089 [Acidobacteria bacterium ADurb.Bin340]
MSTPDANANTKAPGGLIKAMQARCGKKTPKLRDEHLRNHRLTASTADTLARMQAMLDPDMAFETFMANLLDQVLSPQDRKALEGVPEETLSSVRKNLFREPFSGFKPKTKTSHSSTGTEG